MKPTELKARLDLVDAGGGTEGQKARAKKAIYAIAAVQGFLLLAVIVWIGQAVIRATFFPS